MKYKTGKKKNQDMTYREPPKKGDTARKGKKKLYTGTIHRHT